MKFVAQRKRRINWERVLTIVCFFSFLLYLCTSVGIRSYNSYLNVVRQECELEIAALTKANETAQMEVNQLSTYDRIVSIATADGMKLYSDNNVVVTGTA